MNTDAGQGLENEILEKPTETRLRPGTTGILNIERGDEA